MEELAANQLSDSLIKLKRRWGFCSLDFYEALVTAEVCQ